MIGWLNKLKKNKETTPANHAVDFPIVIIDSNAPPPQYHQQLEERVRILENTLSISQNASVEKLAFPQEVLDSLPNEVQKTVKGIIHNYDNDFCDFCFLGMRKALIDGIRIRFKRDGIENKLYDTDGNAYSLERWIAEAKQKHYISREQARDLDGQVKVFGDTASHDYMANLQKEEVPGLFTILRMALSRMYYKKDGD
jgi:hypothetical protein